LAKLGISGARVGARGQPVALTSLVVRDPPAAAVARLHDLAADFPGVELRIGPCEKT
jgi:hypothetical protein